MKQKKKSYRRKQKLFVDIRLYDENLHTIYSSQHSIAEKAIHETKKIINKKIRGI